MAGAFQPEKRRCPPRDELSSTQFLGTLLYYLMNTAHNHIFFTPNKWFKLRHPISMLLDWRLLSLINGNARGRAGKWTYGDKEITSHLTYSTSNGTVLNYGHVLFFSKVSYLTSHVWNWLLTPCILTGLSNGWR